MDDDSQLIEMIISSMLACWTFMYMFLGSELGQRVTVAFEQFDDRLNLCKWYLLPIDIERLYLMFLFDTQHSVYIQCYGGILCARETFKKVVSISTSDQT